MTTLILRSITVTMLAAALFTGCSYSPTSVKAAVKPEKERKLAPNFALKNAAGQTVKLSDYRGKVVVLNFWATWCGPCKIEIPWFIDFQQTYKDKNFTMLGVSMDDDGWKAVTPYLAEHKLNYPIVIGSEEVSQQYGGIEALPTTFVIDQDGRIASMHTGLVSKGEYENEIRDLLDKDASKGAVRASLNESNR